MRYSDTSFPPVPSFGSRFGFAHPPAGSPARLMDRLAMGLKKHALAQGIFFGHGEVGNLSPLTPTPWVDQSSPFVLPSAEIRRSKTKSGRSPFVLPFVDTPSPKPNGGGGTRLSEALCALCCLCATTVALCDTTPRGLILG